MLDPDRLRAGMVAFLQRQEKATEPMRQELEMARSLLEQKKRDHNAVLDLYLTAKIRKDVLDIKAQALDSEIVSLERVERDLSMRLDSATLTEERVASLEQFAVEIRKRLDYADHDFAKRRWVADALNVTGTWRIEDGEQRL